MKDLNLKTLKVIVLSSLLEDAIEEIRGTTLYRQEIKKQCNRVAEMLKPFISEVDVIYNKSPEFTTNIMREIDEYVDQVSDLNTVDIVMLKQIYDTYSKDKENWQNLMNIEFQKLQE